MSAIKLPAGCSMRSGESYWNRKQNVWGVGVLLIGSRLGANNLLASDIGVNKIISVCRD
jgi:hypothetical protein